MLQKMLAAAVIAGMGYVGVARADVITTFDASGTVIDNATLGGTLIIDTTSGKVLSADLTTSKPVADQYSIINSGSGYNSNVEGYVLFIFDSTSQNYLSLILPEMSLVGYDGSILYGDQHNSPGGYTSTLLEGNTRLLLNNGAFTPVPEPASFAVLGMGLLGLVALRRKRA